MCEFKRPLHKKINNTCSMSGMLKRIYRLPLKLSAIVLMLRCGGNAKKVTRGRHNSKVVQHHSHDALNAMKKNLLKDGKSNLLGLYLTSKIKQKKT